MNLDRGSCVSLQLGLLLVSSDMLYVPSAFFLESLINFSLLVLCLCCDVLYTYGTRASECFGQ